MNFTNDSKFKVPDICDAPTSEELAAAYEVIAKQQQAQEAQADNTEIICGKCNHSHKVKDTTYIQTHWYVPPRGCTGGDYYNRGEGNIICEGCGTRIRLCFDCKKLQSSSYRQHFKSIEDVYD